MVPDFPAGVKHLRHPVFPKIVKYPRHLPLFRIISHSEKFAGRCRRPAVFEVFVATQGFEACFGFGLAFEVFLFEKIPRMVANGAFFGGFFAFGAIAAV